MSIIEQATKRLEELRRGGVDVPWAAAGLSEDRFKAMVGSQTAPGSTDVVHRGEQPEAAVPALAARRLEALGKSAGKPEQQRASVTADAPSAHQSTMVTLDLDRLAGSGFLVPNMVRSDLALEFRHVKRPLLKNAGPKSEIESDRRSLIMITSALPSEGKTYCAINLAMSMAMEVDTSVLLIDADVVRPSVLDRFGLPLRRGLLDLLTDEGLDVSDVLLKTNIPKLSILPAGTPNVMATELLASSAMDRLLTELATRYPDRVVILDSPPLLLTTESRVLASRVGQVVIVVDSANTATGKVAEAFAAVASCQHVMSVLNKCDTAANGSGYEYGYGY